MRIEIINGVDLDVFFSAYVECALWSSTYGDDGNESPLDDGKHELAEVTKHEMRDDCRAFLAQHGTHISYEACKASGAGGYEAQAGHDFWLTRCGHGAGFWDGDWQEPNASALTVACKQFGNVDLYVGDDGLIYQA